MYRQGDVLIIPVDSIPDGAKEEARDVRGRIVLADGEATGHAHAIKAVACMAFLVGARRYLQAQQEVVVEHEEHDAITLPPGNYEFRRQEEYRYGSWQRVVD